MGLRTQPGSDPTAPRTPDGWNAQWVEGRRRQLPVRSPDRAREPIRIQRTKRRDLLVASAPLEASSIALRFYAWTRGSLGQALGAAFSPVSALRTPPGCLEEAAVAACRCDIQTLCSGGPDGSGFEELDWSAKCASPPRRAGKQLQALRIKTVMEGETMDLDYHCSIIASITEGTKLGRELHSAHRWDRAMSHESHLS